MVQERSELAFALGDQSSEEFESLFVDEVELHRAQIEWDAAPHTRRTPTNGVAAAVSPRHSTLNLARLLLFEG